MTHMRIARWQRDISWLGGEKARTYPTNNRLPGIDRRGRSPWVVSRRNSPANVWLDTKNDTTKMKDAEEE